MQEPNAGFVLMDNLLSYARPAQVGAADLSQQLKSELEKCFAVAKDKTKPLLPNNTMLRSVLAEYAKNAQCAKFFQDLAEISKRVGFWDPKFYTEALHGGPKEPKKEKAPAEEEKHEEAHKKTGEKKKHEAGEEEKKGKKDKKGEAEGGKKKAKEKKHEAAAEGEKGGKEKKGKKGESEEGKKKAKGEKKHEDKAK